MGTPAYLYALSVRFVAYGVTLRCKFNTIDEVVDAGHKGVEVVGGEK